MRFATALPALPRRACQLKTRRSQFPSVEGCAVGGGVVAAVVQAQSVPVGSTTPRGCACHPSNGGEFLGLNTGAERRGRRKNTKNGFGVGVKALRLCCRLASIAAPSLPIKSPAVSNSPPVEGYAVGGGVVAAVMQTQSVPVGREPPRQAAPATLRCKGNLRQQRHAGLRLALTQFVRRLQPSSFSCRIIGGVLGMLQSIII